MSRTTELLTALAGVAIASTTMLAASEAIALHHTERTITQSAARLERIALRLNADLKPVQARSEQLRLLSPNDADRAPQGLQVRITHILHMNEQAQ
jgi:hypothetical protein